MAFAEKRGKWWRGRYKRPDGTWGSVSKDQLGQRFRTKRAAETYAEGVETDVRRKTFVDPRSGRITVGEWSELWMASLELGPLSERDYRSRLRATILPRWGDVPVGDITTIAVTTWEKSLRAEGRSPNSIRGIRSVMRTMLADAVASGIRGDNPVPEQKGKRRGRYKPKPKADEKVFPNARQALAVARNGRALRGPSLYVLILTSYNTGMRIGELAGLTWSQVALQDDGQGARILLEHQSQYIEGKPTLVEAKYGSARSLIIPPFLAELLSTLPRHDHGFVFTAPQGGRLLIGGDFYTDTWRPIVDGRAPIPSRRGHRARPGIRPVVGIEGMVPHGLRHGHRVALDEAGHPRVVIEERMGHEVPGVEGVYSHTTLAMEQKVAETLQTLWEESLRPALAPRLYGPAPRAA